MYMESHAENNNITIKFSFQKFFNELQIPGCMKVYQVQYAFYNYSNSSQINKIFFLSRSVMTNSFWPHALYSPWNSPGQNTEVGSHSLLQGIVPTQIWKRPATGHYEGICMCI